ncbi:MAG: 4-hydroxy-tetrahydrodipicolinate reductase [Candidatus Odyssella sp.]|nr:4-hydroxy-tetrahydrodipicolinate reductase [Candidatus Odyssella sp.]
MIRIALAGATGWVGRALVAAIAKTDDLALVAAVSRSGAGRDAGEAAGIARNGVVVAATLAEALRTPSDVVVDYTKPNAVKGHALAAIAAGRHVVVGASGLGADDYAEIGAKAAAAGVGVIAAGNFSITATLLKRFTLEAARYVRDVEIVDYASAGKPDTPSGTGRELAEILSARRQAPSSTPVEKLAGIPATRGAAVKTGEHPVQVHSLRLPGYVLAVESVFGAPDERLTIRHDAGSSASPYVAGTLLAIRKVSGIRGLVRGLENLIG